MTYLIMQTFVLLLVSALLGLVLGWYLTRLSAATARSALQAKVDKARAEVKTAESERDAAIMARDHAETERRLTQDELIDVQARLGAAEANAAAVPTESGERVAALESELAECRKALEAFTAPPSASEEVVDTASIASAAAAAASGAVGLLGSATKPMDDEGEADDLQEIKGIGPKIAMVLNELGVCQYAQIAAWTPENVARINDHLKFKGRVERERWIEQATELLEDRHGDA